MLVSLVAYRSLGDVGKAYRIMNGNKFTHSYDFCKLLTSGLCQYNTKGFKPGPVLAFADWYMSASDCFFSQA